ncbi:hypothetical protein GDO86_000858 [Hymenochirus boettgeri]|uniref:DNA 3'-5' helicase n=1 Tax=Hymenochirus boettgeri TaxID=247094 RepID=A0A8T2KDK6_9PIPI|nr:hypothetical protein GDO86_000858 [Hymenochirus boettgeri]
MTGLQRTLPQWMTVEKKVDTTVEKKSFCKKNILEDDLPCMEFSGSIVYSCEANDCSLLAEDIRISHLENSVLGFDIEWPPGYTKGKTGKVALVQVCVSEEKCYLFHVSSMVGFPKGLKRLLEDESVKKVGVGIEGDQWKLMSDYDLKLKGFIELSEVANEKLKCKEKWSLNGLVKHLFQKQLLKDHSIRCSRWDVFPLSEDQKLYAASDAYAGFMIFKKLKNMDEQEGESFLITKVDNPVCNNIRSQLTDLSKEFVKLAEHVPSNFGCFKEAERAKDILENISEGLGELRNIMLEVSKELGTVLNCENSEDCSELEQQSGNETNFFEKGNDKPCDQKNRDRDFFMTLGLSEEELCMMEREGISEETGSPDINTKKDFLDSVDEKDVSYVIESDEELESEMAKSLDDLYISPEEGIETRRHSAEVVQNEDLDIGMDEEEDEGIEEDDDDWDPSTPFPNAEQIACLKTYFGHSSFKPVQWKVIHSVLKDRRDNLVVMATGYGKSLCYQFAPVYTSGIGIVISPLISLMEDQVLQLEMSNIPSCFLGSAQSKNVLQDVKAGKMKVIYMTPEFCTGGISMLQDLDNKYGITLVAIDEAHCISEWGHDFRSAYRNLGSLKRMLPTVPIVALTATASPSIRNDIAKSLSLCNPQVTCTSFDRPNLYLEVSRKTTDISKDLQKFLIKKQGSRWRFEGATIVYCPSRKTSEQVTAELTKLGIACGTYHAGMGIKARREVHHRFMRDEIQCVVATVAFGMGINKPDIRQVIHYGAPKEMESYYQEIGRAGRDGLPSSCHALWTHADMTFNRQMLSGIPNEDFREYKLKMLVKMEKYLNSRTCRRKIILSHFEDKQLRKASSGIMGTEKCCDNCKTRLILNVPINDTEDNVQDFGQHAYKLMSAVEALGEKFGTGVPVLFLRGSNSQRLPDKYRRHHLFGTGKEHSECFWKALARQLITEGYLQECSGYSKFATACGITLKGRNWIMKARNQQCPTLLLQPNDELCPRKITLPSLQTRSPLVLQPSPNERKAYLKEQFSYRDAKKMSKDTEVLKSSILKQSPCKPAKPPEPAVSPRELELQTTLYGKLLAARQTIASEKDIPPAVLATNKVLVDMAKLRPTTIENMKKVDGVSEAKATMLAPLVGVVKEFCISNSLKTDMFSGSKSELNMHIEKDTGTFTLLESQRTTYSLFQEQHLSLNKVADVRSISVSAVGMHLWQAFKAGYHIDLQRAGLTSSINKIITDIVKNPPINSDISSLKAIRELVPTDIDTYLIRMVITLLEKKSICEDPENPLCTNHQTIIKPEQQAKNVPVENTKHKIVTDPMFFEKKSRLEVNKPEITQPTSTNLEVPNPASIAPIMLASWNEPSQDKDTEELFSESQCYITTPKRKLPEWFAAPKGNSTSTNPLKKAKTGKKGGLFD